MSRLSEVFKFKCKICRCFFRKKVPHGCLNKKSDWYEYKKKNKMKTTVVHCKKKKFDVYIGRPSI